MASPGASVKVVTTLDLSNIQRRLLDNEVEVLNKYRSEVVSFIKGEWDGWVYAGRPASAAFDVSQQAWTSVVGSTENEARLTVTNDARTKKGKLYAGYVHRTGTSALEWEAVWAKADAKYAPKFMRAMLEAIKKNVLAPKNPRTIPGGMGSAETARRGGRSV